MRKFNAIYKIVSFILVCSLLITGCSKEKSNSTDRKQSETITSTNLPVIEDMPQITELVTEDIPQMTESVTEEVHQEISEPIIMEVDYSDYFEGINGSMVIYSPTENYYKIYNQELALTQHSPCSTFKIISSLIALEHEVIQPEKSTRIWNGEVYWNEKWNKDIDFDEAFYTSCVWYFREVIDEIGKDIMQTELKKLQYGNCDISDWKGKLNKNNNNPTLNGFWIESSLKISPKEQTEVMERIFGVDTDYTLKTQNALKQVMLVSEQNESDTLIYGKTGMSNINGVVDSWFTGFAETTNGQIYFCVYLGETDNENASSAKAKEIAVNIISNYGT